ncbi:GTP-binding protein Obg/CgtA [Candidatus Endolissoclinum faulkneri L5]|uniref:GTPase Obg n=1 Tax=Candidatus Endolissoclinum faulkneri L5 TaxID=1401328 RepID=V9TVR7_9PROT|nr:GTPase ObgE [Candidatus Endolissoclinum faulkneri]AHC73793.1 GTP-binding protein Obg/CgtA [Candidatus Endolissoclinum faulkneri L5]
MKFLDQAKVFIRSGNGGNGCLSFRREPNLEFGGPNGGNGGRGGDVILECVAALNTLISFRYQQHFKAMNGHHGMGKDMTGESGKDVTLSIPLGTQIWDEKNKFLLADMTKIGQQIVLARGGDGGLGNAHFKSSINRTPRKTTLGWPGKEMWIWLRLKLIADAGLIGLPNAGKSTFLSSVSAANPKIASYPFTTIHPSLGVVNIADEEFVLADIPGLIHDAHMGAGLGDRFLAHIERCSVLLHLIDVNGEDPLTAWKIVREEIKSYGSQLESKSEILVFSKTDTLAAYDVKALQDLFEEEICERPIALSSASGQGVRYVLKKLIDRIRLSRDGQEVNNKKAKDQKKNHALIP